MSPEISLPAEQCTHTGSSCKERVAERLSFAKRKLKIELEESRNEEISTAQCNLIDLDSQTCSNTINEGHGIRDSDWTVSAESQLNVRTYLCSVGFSTIHSIINPLKIFLDSHR